MEFLDTVSSNWMRVSKLFIPLVFFFLSQQKENNPTLVERKPRAANESEFLERAKM